MQAAHRKRFKVKCQRVFVISFGSRFAVDTFLIVTGVDPTPHLQDANVKGQWNSSGFDSASQRDQNMLR
jgi:hypothetical protein